MRARLFTPLIPLLVGGVALAAPVPPNPKAEQAKLEALWNDLQSYDAVVRTRAVLALVDHPRAVPFLKERAPPLKASKERTTALLKDLNDDDEKVRDRAFEELKYFDPRLALSVPEQVALATTEVGRRKLVATWLNNVEWDAFQPGNSTSLHVVGVGAGGSNVRLNYVRPGNQGSGMSSMHIGPLSGASPQLWTAAALAAVALDRINTPSARAALEHLATGHADAAPTREAVSLLQHGPPVPLTAKRFDAIWDAFGGGDLTAIARRLFALIDDPKAVAMLKPRLPAIKADKAQVKGWLKDLGSDEVKVWQAAYQSLQYHHPSLALSLAEQIEAVDSPRARSLLFCLWQQCESGMTTSYPDPTLSADGTHLALSYPFNGGKGTATMRCQTAPLAGLSPKPWTRVRLTVLALERLGTPDAVAVLKQVADGHPDILPTQEAKAALKRLEK